MESEDKKDKLYRESITNVKLDPKFAAKHNPDANKV